MSVFDWEDYSDTDEEDFERDDSRFQYWRPKWCAHKWIPKVVHDKDEFHNSYIMIQIPFCGAFIFFYKKEIKGGWASEHKTCVEINNRWVCLCGEVIGLIDE